MKIIHTIFLMILLTSCNSASHGINSDSTSVVQETGVIIAENYSGTLPCGDCEGIDISLQLNNDSSYIMTSVYRGSRVDSSNNSFKDTGIWKTSAADTLLLLEKGNIIKYIRTDSTLTQLDGDGNIITGPLADMFVLHKK